MNSIKEAHVFCENREERLVVFLTLNHLTLGSHRRHVFVFKNVSTQFFMGVSKVRQPVIKNSRFCIPAISQQAFWIRLLQWTHAAYRVSGFKGCDVRVCGPDVPQRIYGDTTSSKRGNLKDVIARMEFWIYFFHFFLRVRVVKSFLLLQYFFLTLQTQCFFFFLLYNSRTSHGKRSPQTKTLDGLVSV